jgi:MinD-like ATPase involved in chromosome partitioning or flagellar assembly
MVMGKGGVGKTTIAASIAVALADRGQPVLRDNNRSRGTPERNTRRRDSWAERQPYRPGR